MDTRHLVHQSWALTQKHLRTLIYYGAVPAFFSILVSSGYLAYQYNAFRHSQLIDPGSEQNVVETASTIFSVIRSHPALSLTFLITGIIIFICYTLTPPVLNGSLIEAVTRIKKQQALDGVAEVGVRRFFPMFEFRLMMGSFSITTLFTESSFVLRWWGESVFFVILPILLFVSIVGFIISILFTYSEFYIVLQEKSLIRAISDSAILVIANFRKTLLIFLLMVLIGLRIILNVVLVLFIPMIIVLLTSYFAASSFVTAGLIISGVIALVMSGVAAYLMGVVHIFTTTVWVLTFHELTEHSTSKPAPSHTQEEKIAVEAVAPDLPTQPQTPRGAPSPQLTT